MPEPPNIYPKIFEQKIDGDDNQQAARDINNYHFYHKQDKKMDDLIRAYKQEQENNVYFNEIIEELDFYLNPVKSEEREIIGLEKKLKDGQFEDHIIESAMRMKDVFWRKVERNRFSKVAQQIFLYIMADVLAIFNLKIYPLIHNGSTHEIIMSKIQDEIINVLQKKLGENILNIFSDSILGMLFFLTGNCHIKWSKT
jgi:hypothetical protein